MQAVWIFVCKGLAIEISIRCMDDAVMIWTNYYDVSADIQTTLRQILNMMRLRKSNTVILQKIFTTDLTSVFIVRFKIVREGLIAYKLLGCHLSLMNFTQSCNTIIVVNCFKHPLLAKLLCNLRSWH